MIAFRLHIPEEVQIFAVCRGFGRVLAGLQEGFVEVLGGFYVMASVEEASDVEVAKKGPLIVRFPRQKVEVEPVTMESEETEAQSKPPRNLIQVYLLAGYLVGRWAWARYQERQSRRKFDGRRNPKE